MPPILSATTLSCRRFLRQIDCGSAASKCVNGSVSVVLPCVIARTLKQSITRASTCCHSTCNLAQPDIDAHYLQNSLDKPDIRGTQTVTRASRSLELLGIPKSQQIHRSHSVVRPGTFAGECFNGKCQFSKQNEHGSQILPDVFLLSKFRLSRNIIVGLFFLTSTNHRVPDCLAETVRIGHQGATSSAAEQVD